MLCHKAFAAQKSNFINDQFSTLFHAGGGNVKIESRKVDIKAASRIDAKNDKYAPQGGEKKVIFDHEP